MIERHLREKLCAGVEAINGFGKGVVNVGRRNARQTETLILAGKISRRTGIEALVGWALLLNAEMAGKDAR